MTDQSEFDVLVTAARGELDDPARNFVVGECSEPPRFELFHAGLSICSQKVRAVLAEKRAPYLSHEMVIVASKGLYSDEFRPAENYRPGYVRLRLFGGAALGKAFATAHTGVSSVETEGFDPCVVPLLVDHATRSVVVDSMRICEHLDREIAGPAKLFPDDDPAVHEQARIVDRLPHPGILYGFHPDDDRRPEFIRQVMTDVHDLKCRSLEALIETHADDPALLAAYRAKALKEQAGKTLAFDAERQRAIRVTVQRLVEGLDRQLETSDGEWVCGEHFTFADIVWGISLYRMHWLGLAPLWDGLPRICSYERRVYERPSLREQVIDYPSPMPPSPHTADLDAPPRGS